MMSTRTILISLLLLCSAGSTPAQQRPELFAKIERIFHEREAGWKVQRILPTQTTDPLTEDIVFHSGKSQASISIAIWKRLIDAQNVFTGDAVAFDNIVHKKKLKTTLPELGDENYMWVNPGSKAWPMVKFRKGNIIATVYAPSVVIARRFAKHILKQLPAS